MSSTLTAIEITGHITENNELKLDSDLPALPPQKVRVIVMFPADDDISEDEWLYAAAKNQAFDVLHDPAEDIYTLNDGTPVDHET